MTAYAILRAEGVELGKVDYVAHLLPYVRGAPGARGVFSFDGYGDFPVLIEELEPLRVIAYRWSNDNARALNGTDVDPEHSTVFRFTLEPVGAGTVLTVVTWLVGVGFVVFGGALLGRHLRDVRILRRGAEIPRPRRQEGWYEEPEEATPGVRWRSDGAGGAID